MSTGNLYLFLETKNSRCWQVIFVFTLSLLATTLWYFFLDHQNSFMYKISWCYYNLSSGLWSISSWKGLLLNCLYRTSAGIIYSTGGFLLFCPISVNIIWAVLMVEDILIYLSELSKHLIDQMHSSAPSERFFHFRWISWIKRTKPFKENIRLQHGFMTPLTTTGKDNTEFSVLKY